MVCLKAELFWFLIFSSKISYIVAELVVELVRWLLTSSS